MVLEEDTHQTAKPREKTFFIDRLGALCYAV